MLGSHTKTLISKKVGNKFIVEVLTSLIEKHIFSFMTNSVVCIIIPPLFEKLKELYLLGELKAKDTRPAQAQAFPNIIYTKKVVFPSRTECDSPIIFLFFFMKLCIMRC